MPRTIRIAAAQMGPVNPSEERSVTISRILKLLGSAADKDCDLAVFPELALSTFFPREYHADLRKADMFYEKSMPAQDLQPLFALAQERKIGFSLGYAELVEDHGISHRYNSQVLIDKQGVVISKYRKIHLPGHSDYKENDPFQNLEKYYFEVGDLGFPVVDAFNGRIGMCICNDRRWPETYRVMGLKGVELIVLGYTTPLENPRADQSAELRQFHNHLCMQAGAYQNSTFVVGVAKAGIEGGVELMGGSCIVHPDGRIIAQAKSLGDEVVVADCDLDDCLNGKAEEFNFERNRRPSLYEGLLTPHGETV
ncbi:MULTISPECIES: nitrilase-related carbon-nitrogen hydrolase [unclassified Rhizobium]|uniref:nitrilase-related carbon-nitrogen hydrolase n=1 Tax=unclassified Rhizobium TaxID=2613769 RepID=UPI0006F85DDC|nr:MULTISPECIES: nitrilase-related carbon-nitrogen hydrolase [unclassified Rhizobium]KQV37056.1 N-carbamoyl-D-amino acid hydrolase [Rhizobium sp. Root1212]KRD28638.1 N-carbamoyl-D-amino acid hydrolase [Rhizobium sp. Root268]